MAADGTKRTILLIGDDPQLKGVAADHLKKRGHDVRVAARGLQGVTWFRSMRPDLVVIDARRPAEGFGMLKLIRHVDPQARAIMVGSPESAEALRQGMAEYGLDHNLLYPLDADAIDSIVNAALAPSQEVTPQAAVQAEEPAAQVEANELDAEPEPAWEIPSGPDPAVEPDSPTASRTARLWTKAVSDIPPGGRLEGYRLADVLHQCAQKRTTGVLLLQRQGHEKRVYIEDGAPVFVRSSLQHETLGAYLLKRKVIDEAQHSASIEKMVASGKRHGEVLVEMGLIRAKDTLRYLNEHIQDKVVSAFGWSEGTYELTEHDKLPQEMMTVPMKTCEVVVEGLRAHFDPKHLPSDFPALDSTVAFRREDPAYSEGKVAMSAASARVFEELALGKSADAIVDETGVPVEQVMGTAYALYVLQLLGFSNRTPAADAAPEPEPEESSVAMSLMDEDFETLSDECDAFLGDYLRMRSLDCFALLDVPSTVNDDEVERAYSALHERFHPDRYDEATFSSVRDKIEELWTRIQRARETLATVEGRRTYAASLAPPEPGADWSPQRATALSAEQHFQAGHAALKDHRYGEAAEAFERALAAAPVEPAYLAHRGWALYSQDAAANRLRAIEQIKIALSLDPGYRAANYFLGRICLDDNNDALALGYFEAAARGDTENVDVQRYLQATKSRLHAAARAAKKPERRGALSRLFRR